MIPKALFPLTLTLIFLFSVIYAQTDTSNSTRDTSGSKDSLIAQQDTSKIEQTGPPPKLADIMDGNRSLPVHLIKIFDEDSTQIFPDDSPIMPFSTKQTCQQCHTYEKIRGGLHFNYTDPEVPPGRKGEPWILFDQISGTQLPVSYRPWKGTYRPADVGLTYFKFTQQFGRHFPGGGAGEMSEADPPEVYSRWLVSGQLEVNCLSCHSVNPQNDEAEFATNVMQENFRWAAAASSGLAEGEGSARKMPDNYDIYRGTDPNNPRNIPPKVIYKKNIFDNKFRVFFDVKRKIPAERCYFCHSTVYLDEGMSEKWQMDEDVHLKSGMTCVDCHRNDLNHMMVRGYENEPQVKDGPAIASLSCKGCHLGSESGGLPHTGRLGAPYPKHDGIPAVHFEILSCTACHSGPWPASDAHRIKTSRANALGSHTVNRNKEAIPQMDAPVFVKGESGKIEPHKLIWPSFWAELKGDSVKPIALERVREVVLKVLAADTLTDSLNYGKIFQGEWPDLTAEKVTGILKELSSGEMTPVYIGGGKLFRISGDQLVSESNEAAEPYTWAFAHDVRPASQSLGVRGCGDCHNNGSGFLFGKVLVQTPLSGVKIAPKMMTSFEGINTLYARLFSLTFFFRPWLKVIIFLSGLVIAGVLLLYGFKGLSKITETSAHKK